MLKLVPGPQRGVEAWSVWPITRSAGCPLEKPVAFFQASTRLLKVSLTYIGRRDGSVERDAWGVVQFAALHQVGPRLRHEMRLPTMREGSLERHEV